jgi:hypothetical protein
MTIKNIYEEALYEGIRKKQLHKEDRFHVLMLQMKEGELLKTHFSTIDAFLFVMEGVILFIMEEKEYRLEIVLHSRQVKNML